MNSLLTQFLSQPSLFEDQRTTFLNIHGLSTSVPNNVFIGFIRCSWQPSIKSL